jgi:signal transduction histidine kinase
MKGKLTREQTLFRRTRLQLTAWYVGVMGATVVAGGILLYHCLVAAERWWFDRSLEALAGTIHDYSQPHFQTGGGLDPDWVAVLEGRGIHEDNLLGVARRSNYYLQVLNAGGDVVAETGTSPPEDELLRWLTWVDADGIRYRQLQDELHDGDGQVWGRLVLGQSLAESDVHLRVLTWILVFSTPLVVVVGVAGYGLSGVAMAPIARSYERMRRFTGDAAHELRTPLATSRTLIHQAQMGQGIPEELIEGMAKQNERLSLLVADLLLLSRLDEGAAVLTQRCCLNDVLSDVTEELGSLAQGLRLRLEPPTEHVWVEGIEEQLYRLMTNLITNGIQYTPVGGSVTVWLRATSQQAVIQVADTGVGIPTGELKQIFERFYRVSTARDRRSGGTGLGLAIVQAIVQQHRGGIRVESEVGQGSCFTVTLPRVG